ncbi:MAG: hypothetical protein ACLFWD_13100, partial [Anaerolineales bacterium]
MENIAIIAYGTWGDVLPSIRLGVILQDAGYGIRMAVTEDFESRVASSGLTVDVLPIDKRRVMKLVSSQTNPLLGLLAVRNRIAPALLRAGSTLLQLSEQVEVLIANEWLLALAASAAQAKGSKLIHLSMKPRIKTRRFPIPTAPPLPDWMPLQDTYNRLTYDLARRLRWWAYVRDTNSIRTHQMNLPAYSFSDYLTLLEQTPSVTLVSRHVVERPPDWAPHHHQPGYLFFDDPDWQPPADLRNFINDGPAPIYLGFGSMHDRWPEQTTQILVRAINEVRQRAVLYSGWAGLGQTDLPEHVHLLNYAPHSWLFPR